MEKDSEIYKGKKERVKSIALKAKKESSDDETSTSESDDEEYAMAVRNFKKFFRRKGKFVRQLREEKKSFQKRDDKKGKSNRNALDAMIQIISLANAQSLQEIRIKRHSLEVVGAIAKMKSRTKPTTKLVSWLNRQMRTAMLPHFYVFCHDPLHVDFMTYSIARAIYTQDHDLHDYPPSSWRYLEEIGLEECMLTGSDHLAPFFNTSRHFDVYTSWTHVKLLKTLSLDESRSPEFNLFSDLEEHSEEEVAKKMAETMEQYMSKTRADYGSGIAMPKIDDKDSFELKGQFLKELHDNTFSGSDHEDASKHIEKVIKIVNLFHIPNITQDQTKFLSKYCPPARTAKKMEEIKNFQQEPDETLYQAWERFKELLMKCPQHYLTEMQETAADAKVTIQEMAEYSQKWHNGTSRTRSTKTSDGLAAIQAQLNNLGREIKKVNEKVYAAQVGCEQYKGPHYTKYCPLKEEGKTLEEAYYTQFGEPF
ncbi:reverse transcriptase domain-containing protein [Tanacetum coccineum]